MPTTPKFDPAALGLTPSYSTSGGVEQGNSESTLAAYSKDNGDGTFSQWSPTGEFQGTHKYRSALDMAGQGLEKMVKTVGPVLASAFLPGVLNGALGVGGSLGTNLSGLGLQAATGALTGATTAGLTGGNIVRGALMGGAGGALSNYLGDGTLAYNGGAGGNNLDTNPDLNGSVGDYTGLPDPYTHADLGNFTVGDPARVDFNIGEPTGALTQTDGLSDTVDNVNQGYGANNSDAADTNASGTSEGIRGHGDEEIGGTGSNTSKAFPDGTPSVDTQKSIWDKLGDKVMDKLRDPVTGDINWSTALALAGLATSVIGKLTSSDPPPVKTIDELMKQVKPAGFDDPLPTGTGGLSTGHSWATRPRIYSADMPSPIVAGRRYAEGGEVEGALSVAPPFVGFVQGEGGGQDDLIDASLSAGEYVFDAESVSMLGDGNNEEGARKLDELRASLRAHKRSAPDDQSAPPAQGALSYMNGGQ